MTDEYQIWQRGHSLVETCVGLAVFAIVSAISAPHFSKFQEKLLLKSSTEKVIDLASQLTTLARIFQQSLALRMVRNRLVLYTREEPPHLIRAATIDAKISVRINTADARIFAYTSNVVSPGRIILSNGRQECSLTLSLRGRIRSSC